MLETNYLIISVEGDAKALLEANGFSVESCTTSAYSARTAINKKHDTISIVWGVDDINSDERELTTEEKLGILSQLDHNHDANEGISWETISYYVSQIE
jgi:hypothetical protein